MVYSCSTFHGLYKKKIVQTDRENECIPLKNITPYTT